MQNKMSAIIMSHQTMTTKDDSKSLLRAKQWATKAENSRVFKRGQPPRDITCEVNGRLYIRTLRRDRKHILWRAWQEVSLPDAAPPPKVAYDDDE